MRTLWCAALFCVLPGPLVIAADGDGDGVPDQTDACPNTPTGLPVDSRGRPRSDFNLDCAVNGLDVAAFVRELFTPPGGAAQTTRTMLSPTPESSAYFGISVAAVQDVDGDGLTDVLVGAKLENPPGSPNDCGRVHLYSGKTGTLLRDFASPHQESDGRFGWGVGAVPDVDGDGRGDVIVGAPLESPSGAPPRSGRAYVFSGATGALIMTFVSPNATQSGLFGFTVAGIPDINGDGRGDVIIGAWHESSPGNPSDSGRAYVFSGVSGALLHTLASPNQVTGGSFGSFAASVADLNEDGTDDIIIGAPGEPLQGPYGAGRAYIFSGASGMLLRTVISPNEQEFGNFGFIVHGVPDVNNDGRGDYVVGATGEVSIAAPDSVGRAYVFSGSTGQPLYELHSPYDGSFGGFASAVAGVADIDGDGAGDVIVGASNESPAGSPSSSGRAYVYSGASGTLIRELISPNQIAVGMFGYAVAGAPDASGDGRGDVIVSGLFENPSHNPATSGACYTFNLADSDGDGVPNTTDDCANTPSGYRVDLHGRPCADFDQNCQVTATDTTGFAISLLTSP